MRKKLASLVVILSTAALVAVAVPQGASAAIGQVCLENNTYSLISPPLGPGFVPGTTTFSYSAPTCAKVEVAEADILRVPFPGPGGSGSSPTSYFGGCVLAVIADPSLGARLLFGGSIHVVALAPLGTQLVHAKVGVLVPNTVCATTTTSGSVAAVTVAS